VRHVASGDYAAIVREAGRLAHRRFPSRRDRH
jgi:hypothetical protein